VNFDVMIGATATYVLLFPILLLATRNSHRTSVPSRAVSVTRFLGEVTFPLYLVHFPLLVLARSLHLYNPESFIQKILVALVIVAVAAAIVPLGTAVKRQLRAAFKTLLRVPRGKSGVPAIVPTAGQ
jgi:peptidoglycan/LPS O-acetylase OafA/YrhL